MEVAVKACDIRILWCTRRGRFLSHYDGPSSAGNHETLFGMLKLLFHCLQCSRGCAEASGMRLGFGSMHAP